MQSKNKHAAHAIARWATPLSIAHDHVRAQGNGVLLGIAGIHSQFGRLERPYEESISPGSLRIGTSISVTSYPYIYINPIHVATLSNIHTVLEVL